MVIEQVLRDRIEGLIEGGNKLRKANEHGQAHSNEHAQQCAGWIPAALHATGVACGHRGAYWERAQGIESTKYGYIIPTGVGEFVELLTNLVADMDAGLIGFVADHARAETFDSFLDHGSAYLTDGKVREAGVIGGVVFEDSVRRICRKHSIEERDIKLDALISGLVRAGILTEVKAKRARVTAGVRTKATHAQWDEFTQSDVAETIGFTRELVANELDA